MKRVPPVAGAEALGAPRAPAGARRTPGAQRTEATGHTDTTPPRPFVTVNGSPYEEAGELTVTRLVAGWCGARDGIAVAVNSEVVPRSEWSTTILRPGDRVEIVTAAAGG